MASHEKPGALVGDNFRLVPYQSSFGCVARLARLNQIVAPSEYRQLLGIKQPASSCLVSHIATSNSDKNSLARSLGMQRPPEWEDAFWYPFQTRKNADGAVRPLRYCVVCISRGYHTTLHQLPWIAFCPWHNTRLRQGCRRCGCPARHNWEAGSRLLTCACGWDLMNESASARQRAPPEGAAELLERYLKWCEAERQKTWLVQPVGAPLEEGRIAALLRLPPWLAQRTYRPPVAVRRYSTSTIPPAVLPDGVHGLQRGNAINVDDREHSYFKWIAASLADHPAADELTGLDRMRLGIPHKDICEAGDVREGGASLSLRRLHPQLIHPTYLEFLQQLEEGREALHAAQRSCPAVRAAQRAVLARAYAEGLTAAICRGSGSAIPARYRDPSPLALIISGQEIEISLVSG